MSKSRTQTSSDNAPLLDQNSAARLIALAESLRQEIAALAAGDEEVIRDTLEGATDLDGVLDFLLKENELDEAMVVGLDQQMATHRKRKARFEQRIETRERLLLKAMTVANWKNRPRPLGTIVRALKADCLGPVDDAKVPAQFWVEPDPTVDRKALLAALKAGEKIDGVTLAEATYILKVLKG